MFRFEGLDVWNDGMAYAAKCYDAAKTFPKEETFSLADQLRRASVSVTANIAEGSAGSDKEFAHYLLIAVKSLYESVSLLAFAVKRGYISQRLRDDLYQDAESLAKRIRALRNTILPSP